MCALGHRAQYITLYSTMLPLNRVEFFLKNIKKPICDTAELKCLKVKTVISVSVSRRCDNMSHHPPLTYMEMFYHAERVFITVDNTSLPC